MAAWYYAESIDVALNNVLCCCRSNNPAVSYGVSVVSRRNDASDVRRCTAHR